MSKIPLFILCLFLNGLLFSQQHSKRIIIKNPTRKIQQTLIKNGIDLRCGAVHKANSLQLEVSQKELFILEKEKIPYNVLIENVTSFYKERISEDLPKAIHDLQQRKKRNNLNKRNSSSTNANSSLQYNDCNEVDWAVPNNFNLGSMGGCLTVSETIAELDEMHAKFPHLISAKLDASPTHQKTYGKKEGTTTWEGQTIYYVRITGNQNIPEGSKPQILYTSMIHSREVSSLMSNIYFMWYLLENYETDTAIKNLVDTNELYFIPIVNPDGLKLNEEIAPNGGGMQRKNLRPDNGGSGVDLNRNFDYFWGNAGSGSSGYPDSESYRGPAPFSEPESQILRDFVLNKNFKVCLMNHSFANAIPHPYGGNPTFASGREDEMHKWHEDMTKYNRYISGATIFSPANGVADDWMVGGNPDANGAIGSGKKILSTTPEHGSSGFWPSPSEIVPIAKRAVRIYLMSAYQAGKYAKLHDLTQSDINTLNSNITFGIERIGQTPSNFTLSVTPISNNISTITSPSTISGLDILTQQKVTAKLTLNNTISPNDKIAYNVTLSNEDGVFYNANFEKYYQPAILLNDNPDTNGLSNWNSNGWVSTTSDAFSGSTALRSNSSSPYPNNNTSLLTSKDSYNFSNNSKTIVQFYAKWDIERNFDFVELQASTNGTNWQSLCGNYNKPNATLSSNNSHSQKSNTSQSFQETNSSGRVYDGDQMDTWVMEEIVIDSNNNNFLFNATNVFFRFRFKSDANNKKESYSTTYDGYFIDDFKIIGINLPCEVSTPKDIITTNVSSNNITLKWNGPTSAKYDLRYRKMNALQWTSVTDIENTLYTITNLLPTTTYEVQVRSKCNTNTSLYAPPINITTTSVNYCNSKGITVSDEYIQKVTLGTIDNASEGEGYGNFTAINTTIQKGTSNTITIVPKWTGSTYNEGYGVWIDYNQDGDFSDNGETIITKPPSKNTSINASFVVPSFALSGNTRMRVSMKYNATPTACETTFQYGEVEDYTVNIANLQPDTIAPTPPSNLSANTIEATSLVLNWTPSTDNIKVSEYEIYQENRKIASVENTTYNVTGLTPKTTYDFYVIAKDIASNSSTPSNLISIETLGNEINYCKSKGNRVSYEWVDYVSFGGMTNSTAANSGYADFTSKIATIAKETTTTLTVSAGFASSAYSEAFTVWIDYNQNGVFETSEKVMSNSSKSATYRTSEVTIPASARVGKTRMRVSMKYNGSPDPCENFEDGEVEDYTVNIIDTQQKTIHYNTTAGMHLKVSPNPTNSSIIVTGIHSKNARFTIVNLMGQPIKFGAIKNKQMIHLTDLKKGIYLLKISNNGKGMVQKIIKK
ncbi:M14 family zinc carboxypeptidase [Tenacibaculum maritimum]|uniref:M14 family zinc carboxypeptidase n=1 Tax=Tenacibaculum maritimum TaxID=107401 RepID=UPI00352B155B